MDAGPRRRSLPAVRLITFRIQEPLPGRVLPEMAAIHGPEEAARRYRAIVLTTLRQLKGLADSRLRLLPEPADASEAIRFWLLPRLAEHWRMDESAVFRSPGWTIDFGNDDGDFEHLAEGEILCPNLGARWVHAALLGLGRSVGEVTGPTTAGETCLHAVPREPSSGLPPRVLPPLPVIRTDDDWKSALDSALGAALKKTWEEEA